MNIQSTRAQALVRPSAKKDAYQAAQKKAVESNEAIWDSFSQKQSEAESRSLKIMLGVGIATSAAVGAFVFATGQLSAAKEPLELGLACLAIGGPIGMGVGGAHLAFQRHNLEKETQATTVPAARQAIEELSSAREMYRNELLSELDDKGVVKATEEQWALGKQGEADAGIGHRFKKASQPLHTMLADLETLSVARQRDGWVESLARDEDSPAAFREQLDMAIKHPNLAEKLQPCGA